MALELHQSNKASVEAISKRFGVAKRTLYRYLERQKSVTVSNIQESKS
ncbi:MAG: helix-turn-helix domain-containing protein [Pseudobdellovibrionaceae bacterium]|nr:helix-turn-helix domain-containing protein [Pseudobdellovibrionaceae bacterium]